MPLIITNLISNPPSLGEEQEKFGICTSEVIAKLLLRHSGESRKAELNVHNPVFSVSSEHQAFAGAIDEHILQLAQVTDFACVKKMANRLLSAIIG
jgi:hypothetical protein